MYCSAISFCWQRWPVGLIDTNTTVDCSVRQKRPFLHSIGLGNECRLFTWLHPITMQRPLSGLAPQNPQAHLPAIAEAPSAAG
jgi:hypothetical protein